MTIGHEPPPHCVRSNMASDLFQVGMQERFPARQDEHYVGAEAAADVVNQEQPTCRREFLDRIASAAAVASAVQTTQIAVPCDFQKQIE